MYLILLWSFTILKNLNTGQETRQVIKVIAIVNNKKVGSMNRMVIVIVSIREGLSSPVLGFDHEFTLFNSINRANIT
jgi:hypothetical protein